jgi:hypothetical protein
MGAVNQKITKTIFLDIRERVRAAKDQPAFIIASEIVKDYPQFANNTVTEYVTILKTASDFLLDLYLRGKVSLSVLKILARETLSKSTKHLSDHGTQDFLAREFLARKLTRIHLKRLKGFMRNGDSAAEALMKATGEMPAKRVKVSTKNLDKMLDEINKLGIRFRTKVAFVNDMLPVSVFDVRNVLNFFERVYMFRHILKEQFDFVDKRVREYLDGLGKLQRNQAELAAAKKGAADVSEGEGAGSSVHDAGSVLQDRPCEVQGEGRER